MSLKSIYYSINHILKNEHVNKTQSLIKYARWQLIKKLGLFPVTVRVSDSLVKIKNKKMSLEGGTKIYTQGMYDFNNMHLVKYVLNNGFNTMLDIGTNIGLYSLIASEAKAAKIYAFEPHPYTFALLKEHIQLNQRLNIVPINKAASNENTLVTFTDDAGSSVNKIVVGETKNKVLQIEACKIGDFCEQFDVLPQVVKIDVEGFELEVLQGFEERLSEVQIFLIEISRNEGRISELLKDNNFAGPFHFDFKNKKFVKHDPTVALEDPIYLGQDFQKNLAKNMGLVVDGN